MLTSASVHSTKVKCINGQMKKRSRHATSLVAKAVSDKEITFPHYLF